MRRPRHVIGMAAAVVVAAASVGLTAWAMIACQHDDSQPAAIICAALLMIEAALLAQLSQSSRHRPCGLP